jgi:4-aminobutyrate aminotransferase / (S)-3-amino-2-methylpropionate transaminase / 5-aminovalerate transaminase
MSIPKLVTEIPGPRSRALYEREHDLIAPGLQSVTQWARVCFTHGDGCALFDADGNTILDFMAGIGVCSIGHAHPAWTKAVRDQAGRLAAGGFASVERVRLLESMREILPPNLTRMQLYSGGAEAVEAALRLARAATGKSMVIGFWGGYHGKTAATRPLSEGEQVGYGMPSPGVALAPYANPRQCLLDCGGNCTEHTVRFLRETIMHGTNRDIAAIICEPVQGRGGNIVPSPGFLKAVREVAREVGALFICDEMITGFYRTGPAFACMHEDVDPDILIVGKGFGNGYPVSGIATTEDIATSEPWAKPSGSSSSYGGNALACAAALATVTTLREERLGENAARVGAAMLDRLSQSLANSPLVADVHGKGLLIGIDLVRDRAGEEPMTREEMRGIFQSLLGRGLLVMPSGSALRINPPLSITQALADEGCSIIEDVLIGSRIPLAV